MENQKDVWNKIAEDWDRKRRTSFEFAREFLGGVGGRILYIGCGNGRNFVKSKAEIYGVDFSEKMIQLAEKNALKKGIKANLRVAEADKTGFPENFFDRVLCISVLHCIPESDKRKGVLKEIARVLKEGGRAFVSVWGRNSDRIRNKPKECFVPWDVGGEKVKRYTYVFDKREIEKMANDSGLEVERVWEDDNINLVLRKSLSPQRNDKSI